MLREQADADGVRRRYRVRLTDHRADVNGPEGQSSFALRTAGDADERGGVAGECRAPLPGAVTKVLVAAGDVVAVKHEAHADSPDQDKLKQSLDRMAAATSPVPDMTELSRQLGDRIGRLTR